MPNLVTTSRSFLEWAQSLPNVVIPAGLESDMQEAIAEAEAAQPSVQSDGLKALREKELLEACQKTWRKFDQPARR